MAVHFVPHKDLRQSYYICTDSLHHHSSHTRQEHKEMGQECAGRERERQLEVEREREMEGGWRGRETGGRGRETSLK